MRKNLIQITLSPERAFDVILDLEERSETSKSLLMLLEEILGLDKEEVCCSYDANTNIFVDRKFKP